MKKTFGSKPVNRGLAIGGVLMSGAAMVLAQDTGTLEKENQDLKARVMALEELAQKQGIMPSGTPAPKLVSAVTDMTISGYVQASYFGNLDHPASGRNGGYLWNNKDNSFSINKVKISFASPAVVRSETDWSAGYRVSLLAGEDAPVLNSGSSTTGFDYLREGYVELNAPIGKGLKIEAGELISLLNWESGDGGAANPNFSQGYQWFYTGNGPAAGVQLDYAFTDWLDAKFRVSNGLYQGPVDANQGKSIMGSLNFTPCKDAWFNVIGFAGDGSGSTLSVNGASIIGGYQVTSQLGTGFEADYFDFHKDNSTSAELWSVGGWAWYDFTSKVGVALRAEFLNDQDGWGLNTTFGAPTPFGTGSGITSTGSQGELESFTFTFNLHPTAALKIQPEIRYNHTSYAGGFGGKRDQVIIGAGASYLF